MAMNIKNSEVEALAREVSVLTGESKTEAVRRALLERRRRLRLAWPDELRKERLRSFLEAEVWSRVPPEQVGHAPTKAEREEILGFDQEGV